MVKLTHLNQKGEAHMVDIGAKVETERGATAQGYLRVHPQTLHLIQTGNLPKGDVLATARIAGIMAAKSTSSLIPLCHTIPLTSVNVDLHLDTTFNQIEIQAQVKTRHRTGVEMEALTAVSVCALTLYDMLKSVDLQMKIEGIELVEKYGGKQHFQKGIDPSSTALPPTPTPEVAQTNPRSFPAQVPNLPQNIPFSRTYKVIAKGASSSSGISSTFNNPSVESGGHVENLGLLTPPLDLSLAPDVVSVQSFDELMSSPSSFEDLSDHMDDASSAESTDDVISSCPAPSLNRLFDIESSEPLAEVDEDESPWEESLLLDSLESEITLEQHLSPPSLSESAKEWAQWVKEVPLDYEPLRQFLMKRPIECAYILGYLSEEYTHRCRAFVIEPPNTEKEGTVELQGLLFEYTGLSIPTIWTYGSALDVEALISFAYSYLPRRIYISMEDHHLQSIRTHYAVKNRRPTLRMGLQKAHYIPQPQNEDVLTLTHKDTGAIMRLYAQYPDHLFEPAQLETGLYCGIRGEDQLLKSVAGIHLLNPSFNIAAIGNIVTDENHRGEGLASQSVGFLLNELFSRVDNVALNVLEDNLPAISCYRKFGFRTISRMIEARARLR